MTMTMSRGIGVGVGVGAGICLELEISKIGGSGNPCRDTAFLTFFFKSVVHCTVYRWNPAELTLKRIPISNRSYGIIFY